MKIFKATFTALIILVLMAAGKNCSKGIEEGFYTGTFKVVYGNGTFTGKTTLELREFKYSCEGNDNRIPGGGSGTYELDKNRITFHDENMWTADFDWNLILTGEYDYTVKGKNLTLSARKNNAVYEYDLLKK
ncbi:MAG: hypothetical protein WD824_09935 [Cyclobacteriaceae bacterium]